MTRELSKFIKNFAKETMKGQESALYKTLAVNTNILGISKENLTNNNIKGIFSEFISNYLNSCYKSLILKNDTYVLGKFSEMKSLHNHSEICLLNIIATIIANTHQQMDRSILNTQNYETYMLSVDILLISILDNINLDDKISHTCTGMDISKCDPNKPMFYTNN
jgi:hypothetical protein